jgi:hypothetical protein
MKKILMIFAIVLTVLIAGCSNNLTNNDNLIATPKLPTNYQAIYETLDSEFKAYKLVSPITGNHTSKINFYNIDKDEALEGIVFIQHDQYISMGVLNQINDSWELTITEAKEAINIEKMQLRDIDDNGFHEILVSYMNEKNKTLSIYALNGQTYREIFESPHEIFVMENLDGNADLELVVIKNLSGFGNKAAILYKIDTLYGNNEYIDEISMDAYIQGYQSITVGPYIEDKKGIFIDVNVDNLSFYTDLITVENGKINNLFRSKDSDYNYKTLRRKRNVSRDIDQDGIIEVPLNEVPKGYENLPIENIPLFTNWYEYSDGQLIFNRRTYESFANNIRFYLKEDLPEKLSVIEEGNEVRLVYFIQNEAKDLLSVTKIERTHYDNNKNQYLNDYGQILHIDMNYVYLVNIYDTLDNQINSSSIGKIIEVLK